MPGGEGCGSVLCTDTMVESEGHRLGSCPTSRQACIWKIGARDVNSDIRAQVSAGASFIASLTCMHEASRANTTLRSAIPWALDDDSKLRQGRVKWH